MTQNHVSNIWHAIDVKTYIGDYCNYSNDSKKINLSNCFFIKQSVHMTNTIADKSILTCNTTDTYSIIDTSKLPWPLDIVQKLSVVKSVIIGTVWLGVIGWSQYGHLVTINGIVTEEVLHLGCNLKYQQNCFSLFHLKCKYRLSVEFTTSKLLLQHQL